MCLLGCRVKQVWPGRHGVPQWTEWQGPHSSITSYPDPLHLLLEWEEGIPYRDGSQRTMPVATMEQREFEEKVEVPWRKGKGRTQLYQIKVFVAYAHAQVESGAAPDLRQALQQLWQKAQEEVSSCTCTS